MQLVFKLLLFFLMSHHMYGVTRPDEAYCYDDKGIIKGDNVDTNLRIASLSKLFSSYFIAHEMGLDHQYETTFELTEHKKLIIRGSKDPYFLEHGIFYIISTLVQAGITNVIEVLVDDDFYFHFETDANKFIEKLELYFNTHKWNRTVAGNSLKLKDQYQQVRSLIKKRIDIDLVKSPIFSVTKVRALGDKDIRLGSVTAKWVLPSVKMIDYLKILNSYSNNMTTDELINQLGGIQEMNRFFNKNKYGISFVTGSGLNQGTGIYRQDNYATCRKVLKVMGDLRRKLKKSNYTPDELLPMASDDVGTLNSRFAKWDYRESFVFKTGTLKVKPTSALAAMHRSKSLNLVVLGQDYTSYPHLKAKEITRLNEMVKDLSLEPIKNDYSAVDFLMFQKIRKAQF